MKICYVLTPELRFRLKKPLGMLIRGSFAETVDRFKNLVGKEKPRFIVSVGDTVSRNLVRNNLTPKLMIVDNRSMRRKTQKLQASTERTVQVENPPATITEEAVKAIKEALTSEGATKITVNGEEDLLALIAVMYASENSFVVYGQPYEGMVVIKVTPSKKAEIAGILELMEKARKAK
ncbi:MAG: DUF359 domain-containing protein [Candidatus Bathyarchaeia archaeon]